MSLDERPMGQQRYTAGLKDKTVRQVLEWGTSTSRAGSQPVTLFLSTRFSSTASARASLSRALSFLVVDMPRTGGHLSRGR